MPSQRYLKAQRTRWRRVLEEDSKKLKEGLEEVRENGEAEVDLKDLKETVSAFITYVTRFKETTEKLSILLDEEGDKEKIEAREKEEEEEFYFLKDVEGLICKVNSTFEKKRPTAKKLIKNQQNTKKEILQLIQLYFQGEKKMPEQTTQELKQIEMKTNKQTNQAINETKQDNDKQSNYEQMNNETNEDFNKPTKKKRKRVKRKTTNQENIETNENEISTNEGCTQHFNKQEEEINTDERNDEMNRKRKLQCQKGREYESPVGESNKGRKERFQQKNHTNKGDSTDSDNHISKQDDKNSEKEDEETDLYYKLKLVERYKYKLK